MANEFIARKGLIVLANGIVATGSTNINGDITASGDVVAVNFRGSGQYLTNIAADSVQWTNVLNKPAGIVSSSVQINTGSFSGSFKGDGSQLSGIATNLRISGSTGNDTLSLLNDDLTFTGGNGITTTVTDNTVTIVAPTGTVTASGQIDHNATTNYVANQHIDHSTVSITAGSGLTGGGDITATRTLTLDTGSIHFTDGVKNKLNADSVVSSSTQVTALLPNGSVSSSTASSPSQGTVRVTVNGVNTDVDTGLQTGDSPSFVTITSTQATGTAPLAVSSRTVVTNLNADLLDGLDSSVFASTGSNTFTGVQTISNTTNSTNYTDGALIVQGGVGVAKDVNISGSLNVQGLLTVASMSTQYVTSSQYTVGVSRILVNDDDLVRFAGISVVDSGSTAGSGSLLWDSVNNHWIYENTVDANYNSAILISGPKNFGNLGDEAELIAGRIPVSVGGDHIDTSPASSSIYIDFADRKTYIEAGLYVTGAISSSVGFWGDGSNLTGVVSTLSVTGSQGGQDTINLKTQGLTVTGTNGVAATVSGQTLTLSGSNATTTSKGVASFNSTNFTVTSGEVTSNNITINGTGVTLGGTRNITLGQITAQGATTTDAVTLSGGATIGNAFSTSSIYTATGPTTNEVVMTLATGSYDAAHFDYVIKDGTNLRTGTVMSVWSGNSIEFTDTSTNDIGNTLGANFTVDTSTSNIRLKFTVSSGTWTIKTSTKLM